MTSLSMSTQSIPTQRIPTQRIPTQRIPTVGYAAPSRLPAVRRLVLVTGLALVSWSRRPQRRLTQRHLTHEQQARLIQTETSRSHAAQAFRYGIAQ